MVDPTHSSQSIIDNNNNSKSIEVSKFDNDKQEVWFELMVSLTDPKDRKILKPNIYPV